MKKIQKKEKGFLAVDIGTAMLVTIIFVSIMTSMLYSLYMSSVEAKRTAMALNYTVDIFERIGTRSYASVDAYDILSEISIIKDPVKVDDETATGKILSRNRKK